MNLTTDEVDGFLETAGKDRQWLADEIGCSRGTVNNWFSAKILPLWAEKSISRLIAERERSAIPSDSDLQLSLSQWQIIQRASDASGAESVQEFIKESALAASEQIIKRGASQLPK